MVAHISVWGARNSSITVFLTPQNISWYYQFFSNIKAGVKLSQQMCNCAFSREKMSDFD